LLASETDIDILGVMLKLIGAMRNCGRIEMCRQSSRPTVFNWLESDDVDMVILLGWRLRWWIQK